MTALVLNWSEVYEAGSSRCGGKGYNLARLARYGFKVPRGGVVAADVYSVVLSEPDLAAQVSALSGVAADDTTTASVQEQLRTLQRAIENGRLPAGARADLEQLLADERLGDTAVAVRSSAVGEDSAAASFAGIHESVLNVRGLDAIEAAILRCFASLWTPTALAYRRRLKADDAAVRCAVVIMAMVQAPGRTEPSAAGVAFSCDPRTGRRNVVVINAANGMGDKVVQGAVNPDAYVVVTERGAYRVERTTPHDGSLSSGAPASQKLTPGAPAPRKQPVLTEAQQLELARMVWRIHWALGEGQDPQDVEWAHDGRELWVVQARPVTRLPRYTFDGCRHLPAYWSTANIKDAVPGVVSIAAWSMIVEAIDAVLYAAPEAAGISVLPGLETVRRVSGRGYFDLTSMQWMMYDGLGVMPAEIVKSIGGHQPEIPVSGDPLRGPDGSRRRRRQLRLLGALLKLRAKLRASGLQHLARVRQYARQDFGAMTDAALLEWFGRIEREAMELNPLVGLANSYAGPWQILSEALLRPVAGDETGAIITRLLAGSGAVTSAEHGYRLYSLAETARGEEAARRWLEAGTPASTWTTLPTASPFRAELAQFLDEFGHRAVYEADIMNPRWIEDPTYILDQVRAHLRAGPRESPRTAAARARRDGELAMARRTIWRRPLVRWAIARLQEGVSLREFAKSVLAATVWPTRLCCLEIGCRLARNGHLDRPDDVFHLAKVDLFSLLRGEWTGEGARALTGDRAARRREWLAEPVPPDVIVEGETTRPVVAPVAPIESDAWSGIGVSSGSASGPVRLIRHPEAGEGLQRGDVLVAPSTDPGWTPLFLRASAIVMESGGYLSHGAIVAREFGLPAVVNIPGILEQLRDNELVTVDGDAARVYRGTESGRDGERSAR